MCSVIFVCVASFHNVYRRFGAQMLPVHGLVFQAVSCSHIASVDRVRDLFDRGGVQVINFRS